MLCAEWYVGPRSCLLYTSDAADGLTRANVTGYVIEAIGRRLQAVDEALCREEAA